MGCLIKLKINNAVRRETNSVLGFKYYYSTLAVNLPDLCKVVKVKPLYKKGSSPHP